MILRLSIPEDRNRAGVYFGRLLTDEADIELKRIARKRTVKQNRYLHALFTLFGGEFGYSTDEAKVIVKRELGYTYRKQGTVFLRHTSDMDSKEMSEFIDRFRNFSAAKGCYLPSAEEFNDNYVEIMRQIEYIEAAQKKYSY